MNKKHNRLLDSSKIQQEPLHKDKVKRNQVSGNIGENMNSEYHEEKVIKELEFNDELFDLYFSISEIAGFFQK